MFIKNILYIKNNDSKFKPTQNISVNYKSIIGQVIKKYFPNIEFNLLGKLECYPVTEKEKKRTLEKNGKRISKQRLRYFTTQVSSKTIVSSISNLICDNS